VTAVDELLTAARRLLVSQPVVDGWRACAVATLTRQALEVGIDAFWRRVAPGTEAENRTVQLLCLPVYAGEEIGGLASTTWVSLSSACHVRGYDLVPSSDELARWADNVEHVLVGLDAAPTSTRGGAG
jgi:hypothetical protein